MLDKQTFLDHFPPGQWWPLVNRASIGADSWAALTAAILVLPQAIAFAAIAGLPIEYGFYTAMVTPIIAALFGSSLHMISGPTTAISVLLFASLSSGLEPGSPEFIQAAITLTLLAGLFQVALGVLRLGGLANFVSPSVMVGFTAGAAVIIVLSQLPHALGVDELGGDVAIGFASMLVAQLRHANLYTVAIALTSLLVAAISAKLAPRWPNYLLALAAGTLLAAVLDAGNHGVSFVATASAVVPPFAAPSFSLDGIRSLAQSAFAIALVGLLEATAISRSLAMRSGQDVDVNQEFIGQGMSNAIGSFFSAYMGSGSFTRSALNYEAGAKTPLSAILSSIILFLLLLLFGSWTSLIPIPAIAGIILLVAFRLLELEQIGTILRTSSTSSVVMLVTFLATLFVGLEFGVYVGVLVSLSFFLRRTASPYLATIAPDPNTERKSFRNAKAFDLDECPQLGFTRLDGQLYFGSLEDIRRQLRHLESQCPEQINMLLLMKGVGDIDMPGAQLLIEEAKRRGLRGGKLFLTARRHQVTESLGRYGVIAAVGPQNVYTSKGEAIDSIVPQLDPDICSRCDKRIFRECPEDSG